MIFTCDSLATAENPHVTIVTNKHKLAADTHVDTAEEHDGARHDTPQQQEEQRSLGLIINDHAGVVILIVVTVKYCPAGVVCSVSPISAVAGVVT